MKWVVLAFCLMVTAVASAQNCVVEGAWMGNSPSSLRNCCAGLQLNPPPAGMMGSAGQCLKKQNGRFCIGENLPVLNFAGAVSECCSGLSKVSPSIPDNRVIANCVKIPECIAEGQPMPMNPTYRRPCCQGLSHRLPTSGRLGDGGTCEKQLACVQEGGSAGVYPGAPDCCQGLVRKVPTDGRIGGADCVKPEELNCVPEGAPKFVYPNAPNCCRGLSARRPSATSPIGFADVCLRGAPQVQVNNSEARKELVEPDLGLRDDPASVSNE